MNHRSGYSLFEVLLAFTILAMVLAVLLPGQSNLLRRANDAPARLLALDYAASRLAAIGVETAPQPGNTEYRYRDWLVQTEIKNDATNITNLPLLVSLR